VNGPTPQTRPAFDENTFKNMRTGETGKQDILETLRAIQHQVSGGQPGPYPSFEELMNAAKSQRRQQER